MNPPPLDATEVAQRLLAARSVAVVGASDDPAKPAGRILRYLRAYGYAGAIYPINPRRTTVQGLPAYPGLADCPAVPELVVVVVPARDVAAVLDECGRVGARLAVVFSSGFGETGPDGIALQDELVAVARAGGVRVVGPNCVGAIGSSAALTASFMTGLDQDRFTLTDDGVVFVSQSGALGAFIYSMAQASGVGVGLFVSTGNEADVTVSEALAGAVAQPRTRVALGYVEGIRDPQVFLAALRAARERDVPVCLMKVGRSARGADAARSHTGALAGEDAVYSGVFEQFGVVRAEDIDTLLDVARIVAGGKRAAGRRLTIVTLSGGAGALMTDQAETLGLDVPRWDDEWSARMAERLPAFAACRNPIDTTGVIGADPGVLGEVLEVCGAHPDTDVVVVLLGNMDREEDVLMDILARHDRSTDKPLVVVWVGGTGRPVRELAGRGIPCYPEPMRALRAVAALARRGPARPTHHAVPTAPVAATSRRAIDAVERAVRTGRTALDELETAELLADYGIRSAPAHAVADPPEAVAAAGSLGYPVAVKLLSDQVQHKTELAAVHLGCADAPSVERAARDVLDRADRAGVPAPRLTVARMVTGHTELLLGMRRDPVFGPVIAFGFGGVLTELHADVQVRVPPLTPDDAASMIDTLRHADALRGFRGRHVDLDAVRSTILGFADLVADLGAWLDAIEVNPLLIAADGRPVAVDGSALLTTVTTTSGRTR